MSTPYTNWQNQRGRGPLSHCAAFKTYQSVTAGWTGPDSRGDRDISCCLWHSDEVWQRLAEHEPGWCLVEVFYIRSLTERKQFFTCWWFPVTVWFLCLRLFPVNYIYMLKLITWWWSLITDSWLSKTNGNKRWPISRETQRAWSEKGRWESRRKWSC